MRFVDVTNDVAFRRIFGNENKTNILISFINAVLRFKDGEKIVAAKLVSFLQLPRIAGENASIIDVGVTDANGQQFVVEIQVPTMLSFKRWLRHYTSHDYSTTFSNGENDNPFNQRYFIIILNFVHFGNKNYLSYHATLNEETYENELDDIKYAFIELPKFNLKVEELKTLVEKWVFFIKEAENLDLIPDNVDDEGLLEAYKDAERYSWKKEDLIAYDNASIAERDAVGRLEFAERRGMERGAMEKTLTVIKKCLSKGMSVEAIAEITDLTVREVAAFIKDIQD